MRKLGFHGVILTARAMVEGVSGTRSKRIVILTDLDREGAVLASIFVRKLTHDGTKVSLNERLRLKKASHGIFLHVENLSRFALD